MQTASKKTQLDESAIFEDLTLYKIVKTKQNRYLIAHLDGSVSTVIPFKGINNTSMTEADYEVMFRRVQTTIEDIWDPNITVQFVMMRDNNITAPNVDQLPSYLKPRAQYLQNLAENYQLFVNRFYLSIHCANRNKKRAEGLIDKAKSFIKKRDVNGDTYQKNMSGLNDRVATVSAMFDSMVEMLNGIGAEYTAVTSEEQFYNIFQQFTRPSKSKNDLIEIDQSPSNPVSPRRQLFSGIRANVNKSDFILDEYFHKVYTLDRAPKDEIYGKTIDVIENVPFEFIYSVAFRIMTQDDSIKTFKSKLMEKKIIEGSNEGAMIDDRTKTAETERIDSKYTDFAYGDAMGIATSVNFVLRVKDAFIDKLASKLYLSRREMLGKIDQDLTKKIFSKFGRSEWGAEENTGWMIFNQVIPGFCNLHAGVLNDGFLVSENIPYFFAMYDNQNDLKHDGTNHFIDMRGNRLVFDVMDNRLPAWNYSISGQTGSGKSVLMNTILTMQFASLAASDKGPIICILDVGGDQGSYTKFMRLVGGTQINLSGAIKPRIQLLELVPERSLPTPDKIKEVADVIFQKNPNGKENAEQLKLRVRSYYDQFIEKGGNNLNDYQRKELFTETFDLPYLPEYKDVLVLRPGECEPSLRTYNLIMGVLDIILSSNVKEVDGFRHFDYTEVGTMLRQTYRETKGRFPYLSDFYKVVERTIRDEDGKMTSGGSKLLVKLRDWTRDGSYSMFDLDSTINIESDVILADLKGLENEPQLQMVYTLLISEVFNNKMYFTPYRRKLMVRDEAWSLMKNARARDYFVEDLRTARKNGFATIALSQLPTDYNKPDPDVGRAIRSNMQVNIFCKFSSASICQEIGQEYNMNQDMIEEMKELGLVKETHADGSRRPAYSKFMMLMDKSVYVLKNLLHPFEYQLYSSSAEDNAVINYYMKETGQFKNIEDCLWHIAERRHVGDEGLIKFLENNGLSNKLDEVRGKVKKK